MCKLCQTKPVYEFTNKRKLCKNCFIKWFEKKFLFINQKFGMLKKGDVIGILGKNDFRVVVLKHLLENFKDKLMIEIVKLHSLHSHIDDSQLTSSSCSLKNKLSDKKQLIKKSLGNDFKKSRAKRELNKIAVSSTIDSEADEIIHTLIKGNAKNLKKVAPFEKGGSKMIIKPLYLFLDEEVLLYATLKKLKFRKIKEKKDNIGKFIDSLEKKHPEVKRAIVKSCLEMDG